MLRVLLLLDRNLDSHLTADCQQAVLQVLLASRHLSDQEFWLAQNEGYDHGQMWCAPLRDEIIRRAVAVIGDEASSEEMATQAALVLASTAGRGELKDPQTATLIEALSRQFSLSAQQPQQALELFSVPQAVSAGVEPTLPEVNRNSTSRARHNANRLIVLLNLVGVLDLQQQLKAQLVALHEAYQSQAIHGNWYADFRRDPRWTVGDLTDQRLAVQQVLFVQSGTLIGKDIRLLEARFSQAWPADIEKAADENLDLVEFGTIQQRPDALKAAIPLLGPKHAERAIPLITTWLAENISTGIETALVVSALARLSGDEFFANLAQALEAATTRNRDALIAVDFSTLQEFGCDDEDSLTELLEWTDAIFSSSSEFEHSTQFAVAEMLRNLLRERAATVSSQQRRPNQRASGLVNEACQRKILSHLEKYSQLTDENFWLAEPVAKTNSWDGAKYGTELPLDRPFRQVMLRRAIAALSATSNSPEVGRLRTQAFLVVRSVVQAGDALSDSQLAALRVALSALLLQAAADLDSVASFHIFLEEFGHLTEPMPLTLMSQYYASDCNELIAALNLVGELNLDNGLAESLQAVHQAASARRITVDYFSRPSSWSKRLQAAQQGTRGNVRDLFIQTVFLQTGALLGKDLQELLQRASQLREEEDEARRRFVQPGDTLAIHIPGVLPQDRSDPPVIQAGNRPPVIGFPVPVSVDGQISLPHLPPFAVQGKELNEVRELCRSHYSKMLQNADTVSISVQFLMRAGELVELRNLTGPTLP